MSDLRVTDVRLTLKDNDAVKAIGSICLNGAFAVRGVRVMEDKNGHRFMAFPSRQNADGSFEDVAFPLSKDLYSEITEAVLSKYDEMVKEKEQSFVTCENCAFSRSTTLRSGVIALLCCDEACAGCFEDSEHKNIRAKEV